MKAFLKKCKNVLLYAELKPEEYEQVKEEIIESNLQNLKIFSLIALIFMLVMYGLTFVLPDFILDLEIKRVAYAIPIPFLLVIFVLAKDYSLSETHILICMYAFMGVLYGFGMVLGTIGSPNEQAVTFVALLLTVPLLFSDRPLRMVISIYLFVAVFIVAAICFKTKRFLVIDIVDVCMFGTISAIVSSYMMKMKYQRYFYEHETAVLSEMDLLTGLHNRNSFEQRLMTYPCRCRSSICCIYADANGLHELNNTKGHEAGDQLIRSIADQLKQQFGAKDAYRTGGDEFVAFALDLDEATLRKRLDSLQQASKESGYPFSVGYAVQARSEIDMDALIKEAEQKMYEAKAQHYRESGKPGAARLEMRKVTHVASTEGS